MLLIPGFYLVVTQIKKNFCCNRRYRNACFLFGFFEPGFYAAFEASGDVAAKFQFMVFSLGEFR